MAQKAEKKDAPQTPVARTSRSSHWLWGADPFNRMRSEMDELFSHYLAPFARSEGAMAFAFPARLDMSETDKALTVKFDLPGMEEKDIEVTLEEGALVVSGQREQSSEEKKENFHRMERAFGSFRRVVPLPCEVEGGKIEAHLSQGVLTITLPKTAQAAPKAKKIEIKSS